MSSEYKIPFGKKYRGRALKEIPAAELENYIEWMENSDIKSGTTLQKQLDELKIEYSRFKDAQPKGVVAPAKPQGPTKDMSAKQQGRKAAPKKTLANGIKRLFMTASGDELPLIDLRGKEYLEVKYRIVWFRSEHPDWKVITELVRVEEKSCLAKATILNQHDHIMVTSHKFENINGFSDFIEKAETGAIGRALALIGYGTQFCADELDEGERIVDSAVGQERTSEPVVPTVDKGPVISIKLPKRNKADEKKLRANGFTFDWMTSAYLRYYDDRFDVDALGFEYEVLERPAHES